MTTTTAPTGHRVDPTEVHDVLKKHVLVDGFHLVLDLERTTDPSFGTAIAADVPTSRFVRPPWATTPKMTTPEFKAHILPAALNSSRTPISTPRTRRAHRRPSREPAGGFQAHVLHRGGAVAA